MNKAYFVLFDDTDFNCVVAAETAAKAKYFSVKSICENYYHSRSHKIIKKLLLNSKVKRVKSYDYQIKSNKKCFLESICIMCHDAIRITGDCFCWECTLELDSMKNV